mmetsp:Transcript_32634/g.68613  ORF Transcript_32634/g.68613 Transcript_32634/m.68613 type:complete len:219 (-) Transcript_32634:833-1489(-)
MVTSILGISFFFSSEVVDAEIPSASAYSNDGTGGNESAGHTFRFNTPATASRYDTTCGETSPTTIRLDFNRLSTSPLLSLISFNSTSSSFSKSPFNRLHSISVTVDATLMCSRNVVVNDCSGGDNAARAHSLKHRWTISSNDDWTVPNALSGPEASCRNPRAERRANSDRVTFCGADLLCALAYDVLALVTTPDEPSPTPPTADACASNNVSRTISAP